MNSSRRKKYGHNTSDSESRKLAAASQCIGGGGSAAGASGGPVNDPALSKHQTQPRPKVGRRRVVACFDTRPHRPVQPTVGPGWLSAAHGSLTPSMSSTTAHRGGDSADVTELATPQTDGSKCILFCYYYNLL